MTQKIQLQLKALRKAKGVTQKELAGAMNVAFQTISKWENGVTMPDLTFLPPLAKYFEVELEVLLGMKPFETGSDLENFSKEDYWKGRLESMKDWKAFYFNDDYLEFLVKTVWKIDRPVHILDCACGYGYLAHKLLPHMPEGSSYTGLDISGEYLEEGRRLAGDNPRIHFVQGDILVYEIQRKYDIVISQLLLCYLPDPETAICKMKAALRPGGMLVAIDNDLVLDEASVFLAKGDVPCTAKIPEVKKVLDVSEAKGELHYRIGSWLSYLFKKNGLKRVRARMSDCVFTYDGEDSEGREDEIVKYQNVIRTQERVEKKYAYYLNHGCSWQEAEDFVKYQECVLHLLEEPDVFVSRASCLYIVWGFKEE